MTQQIRNDRDAQIRAAHRLKELQAKLIVGGENLLDKSKRQVGGEGAACLILACFTSCACLAAQLLVTTWLMMDDGRWMMDDELMDR